MMENKHTSIEKQSKFLTSILSVGATPLQSEERSAQRRQQAEQEAELQRCKAEQAKAKAIRCKQVRQGL